MAIFSPLRIRRFAAKQTETTKQLIAFRLRQEWFALPIHAVEKVVLLDKIYGDPNQTGIALTIYQDQELLVIDVAHFIFGEIPSLDLTNINCNYLVIVKSGNGTLVGLPIDSAPAIRRVAESALKPLPEGYLRNGNIHCVSSLMIETEGENSLFLLDSEKIVQPELLKNI